MHRTEILTNTMQAKHKRKYKKNRRSAGEGTVRIRSGAFHLQYRDNDGVLRSTKLCSKDDVHFSVTCEAVRRIADQRLAAILLVTHPEKVQSDCRVSEFWSDIYLPWAAEINPKVGEPNLRPSTLEGYKQIWAQHLKNHFSDVRLRDYKTASATAFLTHLARSQGRNTIAHIRSLMSGIFTRAVKRGYIEINPVSNAGVDGKTARPKKTGHYSLKESLSILAALADYAECQLVMALSFFWGLRPSEIRGLKWEDFCEEPSDKCAVCISGDWEIDVAHVHVRRAIDKLGNITGLKTDESEQPLPLMIPVAMPLHIWKEQCDSPSSGWLFQTKNGTPANLRDWVRTKIRPALRANGLNWKGLYAGRRGAATMLLQLTGNALASQQLLRHKPGSGVTARHYLKALPDALLAGTKLVEEAVQKALATDNRIGD